MKNKIPKAVIIGLIFAAGIVGCIGLFYLLDTVWNGFFVDWFDRNYMWESNTYWESEEMNLLVREPRWPELKVLLFTIMVTVVILWLTSIVLISHFSGKRKIWEMTIEMNQMKSAMERQQEILKEEAGRKNDLITYLAHDLKTPLTSIVGYLSLLEEAPDMPLEQKAKYVHITLDKALRLENLINEFFDITRFNLQEIVLEKKSIDLYYMLVQMTDEIYPLLEAGGNKAVLKADENITVYGDSEKLARVFHNILKNAISYSYGNTIIEVNAKSDEKEVSISVKSKGKTIEKQKLEAIFEKFFRLDEARATETGGAGLGLAIAKEIVKAHGGKITAESENEWTTFEVVLPLSSVGK